MTKERRSEFFKMLKKHRMFYLFLLPAVVMVFLFSYMPFWGILIAFKDFKMARGIMGSEWVGLEHFRKLFSDPNFYRVLKNTLIIGISTLLTTFPVTIIFTILVNEILNTKFKKVVQTVTYLPHFLSWVVVGTFAYQILSPSSGIVNTILVNLGILDKSVYFMAQPNMFVPIYLIVNLWKETGYSIVVYLAVISGIDTEQYEAVSIDGANRFQKILYVTLPAMLPTICVMLILNIGTIITVGFDPIFNLYNDATYQTADVISTFVYRKGMVDAQFDYSTAVGLFQNVVSLTLVLLSNWFARKANPEYRVI
ncbi:ABC transporter permease subunit [bacterium]|nr:ABC transporter permease subunit [bacterium]MDY3020610.1 ABC transporter permease subunit [Oliverpabstia sp.]